MMPDFGSDAAGRAAASVAVGPLTGYLFAGDGVDVLCFVPAELVAFGPAGEADVDLSGYVRTGWSQRNVRSSDSATGVAHVFPDGRRLIDHRSVTNLHAQLERWRKLAEPDHKACD